MKLIAIADTHGIHIFGHIHEEYGITSNGTTTFINASSYNHNRQTINQPITLDLE